MPFIHYVWNWNQSSPPQPAAPQSVLAPPSCQITHAFHSPVLEICEPALFTLHPCRTWAQFITSSYQLTSLWFLELDLASLCPAEINTRNWRSREAGSTCLLDAGWCVGQETTALIFRGFRQMFRGRTKTRTWAPQKGEKTNLSR